MALSATKISSCQTLSIPLFLAPAFCELKVSTRTQNSLRPFSCSAVNCDNRKRNRETNKKRGVSVIHRTGPRVPLSISKYPLPRPVFSPEKRAEFKTRDDHGLWGFFNEAKQTILPGEEEGAVGRSWTYQELSIKSFEDLHALYWVCVKELNRTETRRKEMQRLRLGYGLTDSERRIKKIKITMGRIRKVLQDRYDTRAEARHIIEASSVSIEQLLEETEQPFEIEITNQSTPEELVTTNEGTTPERVVER